LTRRTAAVWDELIVDDAPETDTAMEGDLGKDEMRAGLPVLAFADACAFDSWLESHGALAPGLWLRLAKKGAPERTLTKSEAIDTALCHGWIDGRLDTFDDHTWLTRFTPRKPRSKWSKLNRTRATALLAAGRMRPAGLAQIAMAKTDGRWDLAYAPASTAEAPPDLAAVLDANPKAAAFFATLTGPNRYAILYRIGAVKTPEARARKIAQFVATLERGETIHG
jgi:uncharacterized protein YdeI (YjbR/CyaY-like superfamily)